MLKTTLLNTRVAAALVAISMLFPIGRSLAQEVDADQATRLSAFGERPAFSPDGKRIAFVGKAYGDAYEIELRSGKVRNLTQYIPHQGVLRIQYLPNGDFLVTAPRHFDGPNSRARSEMWVLKNDLQTPLQPLGEKPLEGIAVATSGDLIAWTALALGSALGPDEKWSAIFTKPTKRYIAEIIYVKGVPQIANRREVMPELPKECKFVEPQDFRDHEQELVFSCLGFEAGKPLISVMGYNIATGQVVTYRRVVGEYNEVEGLSRDGTWAAVECGKQETSSLPPLDICRLELKPNGVMRRLIVGTRPGASNDISNPVVSPDGKSIAFQSSDRAVGEVGEGAGVYIIGVQETASPVR